MTRFAQWRAMFGCALCLAACSGSGRGEDTDDLAGLAVGGFSGRGGQGGASGSAGAAGASGAGGVGASGGAAGTAGAAGAAGTAGAGGDPAAGSGGSSGTDAPIVPRVDNPFVDVEGYVNPEWRAKVLTVTGGDRIADLSTAVWLDRIAAIEGTPNSQSNGPMGLADHLDAALAQGAGYITLVIYNLPGRDCSALASNGELGPDELPRYKTEYIDPIVEILSAPQYRALRVINVIEVDSLPNLVTNLDVPACAHMNDNGGYVQGVAYALSQLGALPNTYNYVDAAHHGWLGWDSNFGPSAQKFAEVGQLAGMENVHGFITNTSNYSALEEPFFDGNTTVNGTSVRQSKWLDWNPYADELSFAQAFRQELVNRGFDAGIGMLIDTSRNGWGGAARPTAASTSTDVNTFVDQSRVDRRIHAGNWCNQSGAGLGERPRAAPEAGIDAYVWIKPPGESDGASSEIPNTEGKGFDRMCDPTYGGNSRNSNSATGALANAPLAGAFFPAMLEQLMQNAHPAL